MTGVIGQQRIHSSQPSPIICLTPRMPQDFDIIIVGGGPAGCATALSLAKHDPTSKLRVLVIDDADPAAYKIGESLPAVARRTLGLLHPSLAASLAHDTAQGMHSVCTGNASAWTSAALHETHALMNPYGAGWHLDRARFDEALRARCGDALWKGRLVGVRRAPGHGWEIDAETAAPGAAEAATFRARWIVDATGRKASVARKIGAKTRKHADLLSFYVIFRHSDAGAGDADGRTLIEAAPAGWWYSARLPHGRRLVMYTTSPADPTARVARATAGFLDMLHAETEHIVQTLRRPGSQAGDAELVYEPESPAAKWTRCTAAGSAVLEPYAGWEPFEGAEESGGRGRGRGWCAVGDAALAFDPLSSQGIITALNSGAFLGSALVRHLAESPESDTGIHSDAGRQLDGGSLVKEIEKAYEQVRVNYDEGRAYYYDVLRRFDPVSGEGNDAPEDAGNFWASQRARGHSR